MAPFADTACLVGEEERGLISRTAAGNRAYTHEGVDEKFFQFAPGSCFKIFNQLNTVEHFAGWKT